MPSPAPRQAARQVASAQAKYVRMTVTGETPLIFWGLLPVAATRKLAVMATAVAGISPPLCLACGIEPFAIAAVNQSDTTDFGFLQGTNYSFAYSCIVMNGGGPGVMPAPPPSSLAAPPKHSTIVLLNRLDPNATVFPDETSQTYRDGAGGMPGNTNTAQACFRVNNVETMWAERHRQPLRRRRGVGDHQRDLRPRCALRIGCAFRLLEYRRQSIRYPPSIQPIRTSSAIPTYTDYTGNGRRIITIPVVDTLTADRDDRARIPPVSARCQIPERPTLRPADTYGRFIGHVHRQRRARAPRALRWLHA